MIFRKLLSSIQRFVAEGDFVFLGGGRDGAGVIGSDFGAGADAGEGFGVFGL